MRIPDNNNPSKVEGIKEKSKGLYLQIFKDLTSEATAVSEDAFQLLKFHGSYQQDDRDTRVARKKRGLEKAFNFMVRNRIPGGRLTARQFLAQLDIVERFGNESIRLTTRQSVQIHGVLKGDLREVIHLINRTGLSTQST